MFINMAERLNTILAIVITILSIYELNSNIQYIYRMYEVKSFK